MVGRKTVLGWLLVVAAAWAGVHGCSGDSGVPGSDVTLDGVWPGDVADAATDLPGTQDVTDKDQPGIDGEVRLDLLDQWIDDLTDLIDDSMDMDSGEEPTDWVETDADGDGSGEVDVPCTVYFEDKDGDGFGVGEGVCLAEAEEPHTALVAGDCDDDNPDVFPGNVEDCATPDDDNCDGDDNDVGAAGCVWYFVDMDEDGYAADAADGHCLCRPVFPFVVEPKGDCDDGNPQVHPEAEEWCNGRDDNCDGLVDEDNVCPEHAYYCDGDQDGAISTAPSGMCDWADCVPQGCQVVPGPDCDDSNPLVHPSAQEICLTPHDDNCNGMLDEVGALGCTLFYHDPDGDGFYAAEATSQCRCHPTEVFSSTKGGDCHEGNPDVFPGALEVCDGIDNNCDAQADPVGVCPTVNYYCDEDLDGYVSSAPSAACSAYQCVPANCRTTPGTDCDDTDTQVNPGQSESCLTPYDDNCNGLVNEENAVGCTNYYLDADQDGFYGPDAPFRCRCEPIGLYNSTKPGDCSDDFPTVHPGAEDVCNGVDDDCDGVPDGGGDCPVVTYYCDTDGDGFRSSMISGQCDTFNCLPQGCRRQPGSDCDDGDPLVYPGATEDCSTPWDDNCDSFTNELNAQHCIEYFYDKDGDGFGASSAASRCQCAPTGLYSALFVGDCLDTNAEIFPGAAELCDGIDNDCDGDTDEASVCPELEHFCDQDRDGFFSDVISGTCDSFLCLPAGCRLEAGDDCNDTNPDIFPGAVEVCNSTDDNCDGEIDEDNVCNLTYYYCDQDGDSFLSSAPSGHCDYFDCTPEACSEDPGPDCEDDNPDVHPGAAEQCNGIDENCTAGVDEGGVCPLLTYYCDADADSYYSKAVSGQCSTFGCMPGGCRLTVGTDCNDSNSAVHPGAQEDCSTPYDDNCDNTLDALDALHCTRFYHDGDKDGFYADDAPSQCRCQTAGTVTSTVPGDCNDVDATIHPEAVEACNGIDDNCDGETDTGVCPLLTYHCDQDKDGFFSKVPSGQCSSFLCVPMGCRQNPGMDCDDGNSLVYPGTKENCLTPYDDNCNGQANELNAQNCTEYRYDDDGDGYASDGAALQCLCQPEGAYSTALSGDCNDDDSSVSPAAVELCDGVDNNCTGGVDEGAVCESQEYYCDEDGDGTVSAHVSGLCDTFLCIPAGCQDVPGDDCLDSDAAVHPLAIEVCNGADDNCDGEEDEGDACSVTAFYCDGDNDGHYSASASGTCDTFGCVPAACREAPGTDCNDGNPQIYPGAAEVCNGIDDNCAGGIDEGGVCPLRVYYCDKDGDSYYSLTAAGQCSTHNCIPTGCRLEPGTDCNDQNALVHPGMKENCLTPHDDNCDTLLDQVDATNCTRFYHDGDSDGFYALGADSQCRCKPSGQFTSIKPGDCNDAGPGIHPDADEVCDGLDNDCVGGVDDGAVCPSVPYYCDLDLDGYVSLALSGTCAAFQCLPAGCQTAPGTDCNDANSAVFPGTVEDCDTLYDDNCNGQTNELDAVNCRLWHVDVDGDGFGDPVVKICACGPMGSYTIAAAQATDCNDADASIHPGAPEVCNGVDENCSGTPDDGGVCPLISYYCDGDLDGFFSKTVSGTCSTFNCLPTGCRTTVGLDCNDANPLVFPGAVENCGTVHDDNCNGQTNERDALGCLRFHADADKDGYGDPLVSQCWCAPVTGFAIPAVLATDCNDSRASAYPGAPELCNGLDDNCDSVADGEGVCPVVSYYCDTDLDGFRSSAPTGTCSTFQCLPAACLTTPGTDCNDADAQVYPGRVENCATAYDDNCNAQTNERDALGCVTWYRDSDADGYGHRTDKQCWCAASGLYKVLAPKNTDCNDLDGAVYPGAPEVCNGIDDNCSGTADGAGVCPTVTYYCDSDADGHVSKISSGSCSSYQCVPTGCRETPGDDCDDTRPLVNPSRPENCDTAYDDNCDDSLDALNALNCVQWYRDQDGDGFGHPTQSQCRCASAGEYNALAPKNRDCNDQNANIHPAAVELCNGIDDNCNSAVDEGGVCPVLTYYCDLDGDTYLSKAPSGQCSAYQCVPAGCSLTVGTDCNDANSLVRPGMTENCLTAFDDNCNTLTNEQNASGCTWYYQDLDGDGFHDGTTASQCWCAPVVPFVSSVGGDCDDTNPFIYPGAEELCNGEDDNCDGLIDETFCTIEGVCVAPETTNPLDQCMWCDPDSDYLGWSLADGQPCNDGVTYTGNDTCQAGLCSGTISECFETRVFDDTIRIQSLVVGDNGHPGQGLNVDGLLTTCAPTGGSPPNCSQGIDNQFSIVDELVNGQLEPQVTGGNIHLLLEFEGFNTSGRSFQINMYDGSLVTDPACDFRLPGCSYRVSKTWFDSDCDALFSVGNAVVTGSQLVAGGPGSVLGLSIPMGGGLPPLQLTIRNAMLRGTVTLDTSGNLATFTGILAGAVLFTEMIAAAEAIPEELFPNPPGKAGTIQLLKLLLKPDLDLDLNGVKESTSMGFLVSGNQAYIVSID
jgi:hypothetical protein